MQLNDALKPLTWLAGRWYTENGRGKYPNIQDFAYHEVLEFLCVGQPMFNYSSSSSHPIKHTPMHQERGFLRIKPGTNDLAFVVSHNFGLTTVEEGHYDPEQKEITLKTVSVTRISFAKAPHVKAFERRIKLISDEKIEVVVFMETENTKLTEHLRAVYTKNTNFVIQNMPICGVAIKYSILLTQDTRYLYHLQKDLNFYL